MRVKNKKENWTGNVIKIDYNPSHPSFNAIYGRHVFLIERDDTGEFETLPAGHFTVLENPNHYQEFFNTPSVSTSDEQPGMYTYTPFPWQGFGSWLDDGDDTKTKED